MILLLNNGNRLVGYTLKASQNQQFFSCFSSHTVSSPAWSYQGLSLMGHGKSPHISHPGNSEVSSFQERPRLLAAAEDPEVPIRSYRLNWMNETNEAISLLSHGSLEVQLSKIHGKMRHLPWDVGCFCIHLGSCDIICAWSHGPFFCRFRRCLNEIWLDLTFLSAFLIAQTCRWLNSFLQTAIAFLLKCKSQTCPDNHFSSLLMDVNHHPIVKYPFCNPLKIHFYLIGFIG